MFVEQVDKVLFEVRAMLIEKNKKYGNSALEPIRVFSNAPTNEQLKVRLDDKLSRIKTSTLTRDSDSEDAIQDLLGYLILLKISNG